MQQPKPLYRHCGQVVWEYMTPSSGPILMCQMTKDGAFAGGYLLDDRMCPQCTYLLTVVLNPQIEAEE